MTDTPKPKKRGYFEPTNTTVSSPSRSVMVDSPAEFEMFRFSPPKPTSEFHVEGSAYIDSGVDGGKAFEMSFASNVILKA